MRPLTVSPTPKFNQYLAANVLPPMSAVLSGEITANIARAPLGAVRTGCTISDVWLSINASGKDNTNALSLTGNVYINGVSCLTTAPIISHVSGEASTNKTTKITGDTGITKSVVNASANTCMPGDMLTYSFTRTRTASPTTEMSNAVIVVEFLPTK
jgi:hypothetical protein